MYLCFSTAIITLPYKASLNNTTSKLKNKGPFCKNFVEQLGERELQHYTVLPSGVYSPQLH